MKSIFLIFALLIPLSVGAQTPDVLFQQAQRLERVQGDFRAAIDVYKQIVDVSAADRSTVARALVRMGKAYESLGRTEALTVYERVVRDFTDQTDEAAEARSRLRSLSVAETGTVDADPGTISTIRLKTLSYENHWANFDMYGAAPSASGRYIARQGIEAGFVIDDLLTGQLTEVSLASSGCSGTFNTMRFSPDDAQIAVSCWHEPGEAAIVLYDRSTKSARVLTTGPEFLQLSDSLHFEIEVYDWTDDGAYVLASIQGWECCGGGKKYTGKHQVALVPVGDAPAIVIDGYYWSEKRDFREMNACMIQNDRFMLGEYTQYVGEGADTVERIQIRAIDVATGEESVLLGDSLYDYELFGCDRPSNSVYFSRNTRDTRQLAAATVAVDGTIADWSVVRVLPADADPVMSQNGALYFTQNLSGEWAGVEAPMDAEGRLSGTPKITGEEWYVHRYAPNGSYIAEEDPSGLSYYGTPDGLRIPLPFTEQYYAQVGSVTGNHFIFRRSTNDEFNTWIVSATDGAVVDSLPGVWARWLTPDLENVYRLDRRPNDRCLIQEHRETLEATEIFCSGDDQGFATHFDALSGRIAIGWTRGETRHISYLDEATGTLRRVLDVEPNRGYVVRWAGGKLYIMVMVSDVLWRYDPDTGVLSELSVLRDLAARGLHQSSNQLAVAQDGSRFQTHYKILPQGDNFELFVIRKPVADR